MDAISARAVVEIAVAGNLLGPLPVRRAVHPLGLVNKASRWYAVCGPAPVDVVAVNRIVRVERTTRRYAPPDGFRLRKFWDEWCHRRSEESGRFAVKLEVAARDADSVVRFLAGGSALFLLRGSAPGGERSKGGTVEIEHRFDSYEEARARILGLGGAVRVLRPDSLRIGVRDYALQVVRVTE